MHSDISCFKLKSFYSENVYPINVKINFHRLAGLNDLYHIQFANNKKYFKTHRYWITLTNFFLFKKKKKCANIDTCLERKISHQVNKKRGKQLKCKRKTSLLSDSN